MTRGGIHGAIAALLALSAWGREAQAAPTATLDYARGDGAEGCPDEDALRRAITARVGRDPFASAAPIAIHVTVDSVEGRLRGRVVLESSGAPMGSQLLGAGRGARGAGSCDELVESIALAVSVALDATEKAAPPPPAGPPTTTPSTAAAPAGEATAPVAPPVAPPAPPPTESPPAAAPRAAPTPVADAAPPEPLGLWAAAGARVAYGFWPAVAVAPDLLVEVRRGRWGLGLEGRYDLPVTIALGGVSDAANASRLTGALVPCVHLGWFVPCAIGASGATWARGEDVASPVTRAAYYAAFGARLGVDVALAARWHLLGSLDVVGVASPTHVQVGASVAESGPVEGSAGIALAASIF